MYEESPTLKLPVIQTDDVTEAETIKSSQVAVPIDELPTLVRPKVANSPPRWRLVSTLVAVGIFVLVNVVVQFNRRTLDVQGDSLYGFKRVEHCEQLGAKPDIIYLGSSRTIFSGDAGLVDDWVQSHEGKTILGCNVGAFSSTIQQDYYTLKRLIEDGYTPKAVVETLWEYNLNVHAAGSDPANGYSGADLGTLNIRQSANLADLSDLSDLADSMNHAGNNLLPEFVADKLVPIYGARNGLLKMICGDSTAGPCSATSVLLDPATIARYSAADNLGWIGVTDSSIATQAPALYADHYQHYISIASGIANFQIGGHHPEYLARLADLAHAHGISLIFTTPPVHPFLFDYLTNPSDWQMIIDYWQQFSAAHNVPYYDLSRAPGYTDADFVDPQHLDYAGATKYATWLAEQVIGPMAVNW